MRRKSNDRWRMRERRSEVEPVERRVLLSASAALAADADIFGGHTYHVVLTPSPMTWADEQSAARDAGGHLVSINSAGEQDFVQGLLAAADVPTGSYSIGGIRTSTAPPTYGWSTGEPLDYTNWYAGEPNGADPAVAMIWTRTEAEPVFARRG